MNDKYQKLDAENLEQVSGGAGVGIAKEVAPGQMGTVFIGRSKFASISGLTMPELQAILPEDPRYALAQEYFAFLEMRANRPKG